MPKNTENLNLYEVDPSTDGNMTFNIDTMMNDNWDKLDAYAGGINAQLSNKADIIDGKIAPMPSIADVGGSNKNLLINWDFRNPVNQRGLSEYTGVTYTVDMWQLNANRGKLNVNDGYITLTNTAESGAEYLRQGFEKNFEAGDVLTLSAEIRGNGSGQLFLGNSTDGANIGGYTEYTATSDWQVITFTKTLESTLPKWWVIQVTGQNAYIDIRRVKLELGSVSTLQNDPPQDYAEELRKCQRYQFMTNASSRWARASKITDSVIYFDVACPATMRANPTITQNNTLRVTTFDVASTAQTGFTFACADQQGAIRIAASKASHGLTDATLEMVSVLFDANL